MIREKNDLREERNLKTQTGAAGVKSETLKRVGIVGAIALVAFLHGFVPMWLSAGNYENERDAAVKTLRPSVLQNNLATAQSTQGAANLSRRGGRRAIFLPIYALKLTAKKARSAHSSAKPSSRFSRNATKRLRSLRETTRRRLTA